jgi:predicted dehydrogenase
VSTTTTVRRGADRKIDGGCFNLGGMSHEPFRVVIIGIGAIAELIAVALSEIPQARLVAGTCRTEAKGRKFAKQFSCAWYGNTDAMLDEERPDVAIIATPSGAHLESALACVARKTHVVCEKPLEITPARVRQMIDATSRAGVRLGAIFPQRFNPVNRAIRDAAAAGRFGNLAVIHAAMPWWRDDAYYAPNRWQGKIALDGGGALMNQAIHTVDIMQWLAAATMPQLPSDENPVAEVFAVTARRGHDEKLIEVEDTASVIFRFRNGAVGQLLAATSMFPGEPRRLQISGRDGFAEVFEDQLTTFQFRDERDSDAATREKFGQPTMHGGGASNPMAMSHENHRRNLADFFAALAEGREPTLNGAEAAKAVQIIAACYESARTNRPVRIGAA